MAIDPTTPQPRTGWSDRGGKGFHLVREVKVWPGCFASVLYSPAHHNGWYWSVSPTHDGHGLMGGRGVAGSGEAAMDEAERVIAANHHLGGD